MKFSFVILILIINYSVSQEIAIEIDSINLSYIKNYVTIPYKFINKTDKEITFLDKNGFHSLNKCYYIYNSRNEYFTEKDTMTYIEDFLTLKPYEERKRSVTLFIHWPCRSRPAGQLSAIYKSVISNEDNYYYYSLVNGKYEIMYINAWIGTIISKEFTIIDEYK
jgi:hypothetical protein